MKLTDAINEVVEGLNLAHTKGLQLSTDNVTSILCTLLINGNRGNGAGYGAYEKKEPKPLTVNFGKFKGKTLEEVLKLDRGYLRWLADKSENSNVRAECKRLLEQNPVSTGQVTIPKPKVNQ